MRFISIFFLPGALSTTAQIDIHEKQDHLCKRLTQDADATCDYPKATCVSKKATGAAKTCEQQIVTKLAPIYTAAIVPIAGLVGNLAIAPTFSVPGLLSFMYSQKRKISVADVSSGSCEAFLRLFTMPFSSYLIFQKHSVECTPEDLVAFSISKTTPRTSADDGLRGVLNVIGLTPFQAHATLRSFTGTFLTQLDFAKNSFPHAVRTGDILNSKGFDQRLILNGAGASTWLASKFETPIRMTFENVMDTIMAGHAHINAVGGRVYQLESGELTSYQTIRSRMVPLMSLVFKFVDALKARQVEMETELTALTKEKDGFTQKLQIAQREATVATPSNTLTRAKPVDNRGAAQQAVDLAERKVYAKTQEKEKLENWVKEQYPVILTYFIYIRTNNVAYFSKEEKDEWDLLKNP